MDDILQRVFSIILSVIIFFLLPIYIAFEKKDDISYSLALKISSNFVDEVCNKGYMTLDMYNDFISNLAVTGNTYDISMEHVAKVYTPVIYAKDSSGKQQSFDYQLYSRNYIPAEKKLTINNTEYKDPIVSYKVNEMRYYDRQIVEILEQDVIKEDESLLKKISYTYNTNEKKYTYPDGNLAKLRAYKGVSISEIPPVSGLYRTSSGKSVYPMNVGDKFTVVIKNNNTTIATMLFNTLTFGAKSGADTKVYINYGGTIKNEEYRQTIIDTGVTDQGTEYAEKVDIYKDGFATALAGEMKLNAGYFGTGESTVKNLITEKVIEMINKTSGYRTYIATNKEIDFSDYKRLCVDMTAIPSSDTPNSTWVTISSINYFNDIEVNDDSKQEIYASTEGMNKEFVGRRTMELDISKVTNKGYITISYAHAGTLKIHAIWLEK